MRTIQPILTEALAKAKALNVKFVVDQYECEEGEVVVRLFTEYGQRFAVTQDVTAVFRWNSKYDPEQAYVVQAINYLLDNGLEAFDEGMEGNRDSFEEEQEEADPYDAQADEDWYEYQRDLQLQAQEQQDFAQDEDAYYNDYADYEAYNTYYGEE